VCDDQRVPIRVLIVDDHPGFRAVARELLEGAGYVVSGEAATARQAIAAVSAQTPDIVLLDIGPPDGNGFTVASQLSHDPRKPGPCPSECACSFAANGPAEAEPRGA
jgi:CheY-like chemotaxis protein